MKKVSKKKIKTILLHQIGDTRYCPKCGHNFVPKDMTQKIAIELYKELRDEKE